MRFNCLSNCTQHFSFQRIFKNCFRRTLSPLLTTSEVIQVKLIFNLYFLKQLKPFSVRDLLLRKLRRQEIIFLGIFVISVCELEIKTNCYFIPESYQQG